MNARPLTSGPTHLALFALILLSSWLHGQDGFPIAPGSGLLPADAARAMTLPPGFRATLFAGEPDVHQPITFTIDERGRLWVVENYSYPDWSPYGRDRVVIFEDTDGDGAFNTRKVFYDQLNFASGLAVGHGGVWVGSPPYLLFIPDKNRDDLPDGPPQPVLDGWGHDDTHETLNSFVWGPDGWLYGNQGVFTHSNVGRPGARDAARVPLNACVWRYHPTKRVFEVFAEGMSNQWGLDFNDTGDAFVTACVIPHLYHVIQGGSYQRQAGPHANPHVYDDIKTIGDHVHYDRGQTWEDARFASGGTDAAGGGHAHAGTLIYLGDSFPAEYRNTLFTHNILGSRINRDLLEPAGSGYIGRHGPDFMKANDPWFRGLRLETGPDGSIFNSDWYDALACHQQRPHDRSNGRIYKLSYGDPKPVQINLAELPSADLVQLQVHPNEWHVRRARLLLQERGPDPATQAALIALLRQQTEVPHRLRVLWALHGTQGLTEPLALELLGDPAPQVRGWTIQLMCEDRAPSAALLARLAIMAREDPSPIVRRFLASAAQRIPLSQRWEVVEALLMRAEDAADPNLPFLYWFAFEPLVPLDAERALALAGRTPLTVLRAWTTRRQAALADEPTRPGTNTSASAGGMTSGISGLITALGQTNDPSYQREILDSIMAATEGQTGLKPPPAWGDTYAKLLTSRDPELLTQADRLAARLGDTSIYWRKQHVVSDAFAPLPARQAALATLLEKRDFQLTALYQKLLTEPALRLAALRGLAAYEVSSTPGAILAAYPTFNTEEKRVAVSLLAGRPTYAQALLQAVRTGSIPTADVDASVVRQLGLLNDPEITRATTELWGVTRASASEAVAEIARWKRILTPERIAAANPSRGRIQFVRNCALCHTLFDEGKAIGPELTGSNRADLDYLLANIVDPNAVIGHDYLLITIETTDGRTAAGIKQRETAGAVTLVNQAETITIPRDSIKTITPLEISLMPPGLMQAMTEDEAADLVAYLRSATQVPLPQP